MIITKQEFGSNGRIVEKVVDVTYIHDEYLVQSVLLCFISVLSFYPVICFLSKQANYKMGKRMFDQMMIYAIMVVTVCHFMSEQKLL